MIFKFVSMPLQSDTFDIKCIGRGADDEVISFDVYDERYTVIDLFGEDVGLINVGDLFFLEHSNPMINGSWGFVREIEKKKDNSVVNVTLGFHLSGLDFFNIVRDSNYKPLSETYVEYFNIFDRASYYDSYSLFKVDSFAQATGNVEDLDLNIGDVKTIGEYEKILVRNFGLIVDNPYVTPTLYSLPYRYFTFNIIKKTHNIPTINLDGLIDYEIIISPAKTAFRIVAYVDAYSNKWFIPLGTYGLDKNFNFVWYWYVEYTYEEYITEIKDIYLPADYGVFKYEGDVLGYELTEAQRIEVAKSIEALVNQSQDSDNITIIFDLNNYIYKNAILTQSNMFNNLGNKVNILHNGIVYDTRIKEISIKSNICTISFGLTNVKLFDRLKGAK